MRSGFELFWSSNPHLHQCNLLKTFVFQIPKLAAYMLSLPAPYSFDGVMQYNAPAPFGYNSPIAVWDIKKTYADLNSAMDRFSEGEATPFSCKDIGVKRWQND